MPYSSPLEDTKFVLENLLPAHDDLDDSTIDAVLSEAGKLADNYLAPLNHFGDKNNPVLRQDHEVETPNGFSNAFKEIAKGGWIGVASDTNYNGMGLPLRMSAAINEYWQGANLSFSLCSLLTQGLIDAFTLVGTEKEKKTYLPKFNSGEWTGTMNLTEPQSGTDLATIKTKAEHDGQNWRIKGQKIYITYGEHDMSENIIHLVLARTEGAPAGIKGISTFIIPKFLKSEEGQYTKRNDLKCISIEHKMGIKASPTAVMAYGENEGAIGYMLGEEGRGIEYMFIMMNRARFDVGLQGMAISEAARQKAHEYANIRVQGIPISREKGTPIIGHGDVRRLLLSMRSLTEAMRALILVSSEIMERAHNGNEDCKIKEGFLIPIIKGWSTELAQEVTSNGVQVHGGMGFIEETGAAQYMRDARILPIYEGTNAIQANDFMFRKTIKDNGSTATNFLDEMFNDCKDNQQMTSMINLAKDTLNYVINNRDDYEKLSCISFDYMMGFGYLIGGWLMHKAKIKANLKLSSENQNEIFLKSKIISGNFYNLHILPRIQSHFQIVMNGAEVVQSTNDSYV
ncbi:acyl-CoA dehydrogenase [Alphaproteobacteria bacterium]|jgi:3-(methylthio)propanoyl-CoA dehydrogenase|nr:acyl-CoA dehydrogenase [Alphaproteobacteria bacterium]